MISGIKMKNFKCFSEKHLKLSNLTLLSGLNGMGKSSTLQALLLLRQSYLQNMLSSVGLSLNGDLVNIGTGKDVFYDNATDEIIALELEWDNKTNFSWEFSYDRETDIISLTPNNLFNNPYSHSLFIDRFQYIEAERFGPRVSFEMSDYQVRQRRWLGKRGEYVAHFLQFFRDNEIPEKLRHINGTSKLLSQVESWLGEISPGTRIDLQSYSNLDKVAMTYTFAGRIGNNYRPTNVGFGITYVLPILVALLASQPDDLILLENPEAHLHPRGQAKMGQLIGLVASLGAQVIVETHSDHLLNGIRLAVHGGQLQPEQVQLHFFDRDKQGNSFVVSPKIDRNGRIDQWPDGFFDEWDKSLMTLLMPAKKD